MSEEKLDSVRLRHPGVYEHVAEARKLCGCSQCKQQVDAATVPRPSSCVAAVILNKLLRDVSDAEA